MKKLIIFIIILVLVSCNSQWKLNYKSDPPVVLIGKSISSGPKEYKTIMLIDSLGRYYVLSGGSHWAQVIYDSYEIGDTLPYNKNHE